MPVGAGEELPIWLIFGAKVVGEDTIKTFHKALKGIESEVGKLTEGFGKLKEGVVSLVKFGFSTVMLSAPALFLKALLGVAKQSEELFMQTGMWIKYSEAMVGSIQRATDRLGIVMQRIKLDILGITDTGTNLYRNWIKLIDGIRTKLVEWMRSPEYKGFVTAMGIAFNMLIDLLNLVIPLIIRGINYISRFVAAYPNIIKFAMALWMVHHALLVIASGAFQIFGLFLKWTLLSGIFGMVLLNLKVIAVGLVKMGIIGGSAAKALIAGQITIMALFGSMLVGVKRFGMGLVAFIKSPFIAITAIMQKTFFKTFIEGIRTNILELKFFSNILKFIGKLIRPIVMGFGKVLLPIFAKLFIIAGLFVGVLKFLKDTDFLGGIARGFNSVWESYKKIKGAIDDFFKPMFSIINDITDSIIKSLGFSTDMKDTWVWLGKILGGIAAVIVGPIYIGMKLIHVVAVVIMKAFQIIYNVVAKILELITNVIRLGGGLFLRGITTPVGVTAGAGAVRPVPVETGVPVPESRLIEQRSGEKKIVYGGIHIHAEGKDEKKIAENVRDVLEDYKLSSEDPIEGILGR